ncbi:hypothetical protein PR202_gb29774 [Eleusine coracana subsp. coracana]|uniref:Uncharacterized protein n=1 Tax=Eleusine coracana subsp. coracana TaxID=191504 RepID=A0AAV5FXU5_ELECO|nr:hypothetical protein PR202_gb29774 [Eleusine coracana subsp. coracana]
MPPHHHRWAVHEFLLRRVVHCREYWCNRPAIAVRRRPPAPEFDHRNVEFMGDLSSSHCYPVVTQDRIKNLIIHFTEEFVVRLKDRVSVG